MTRPENQSHGFHFRRIRAMRKFAEMKRVAARRMVDALWVHPRPVLEVSHPRESAHLLQLQADRIDHEATCIETLMVVGDGRHGFDGMQLEDAGRC